MEKFSLYVQPIPASFASYPRLLILPVAVVAAGEAAGEGGAATFPVASRATSARIEALQIQVSNAAQRMN